jgi:hypothetical protein
MITLAEGSLFILYFALLFVTRKPQYLLAFFICNFLINAEVTQFLEEYQVYLIVVVMYSYIFYLCKYIINRLGCSIIIFISMLFAVDAFLYGVNGYYGTSNTLIYNNIGSIAFCAHFIFICSFINHRRIYNYLQRGIDNIERVKNNGYSVKYFISKI